MVQFLGPETVFYGRVELYLKSDTTNLGRLGIQQPFKGELAENVKTSGLLNEN